MKLDAALIRRRRAELGLSTRTVAKHVRVSPNVIVAIEAGTNHDDISVAHLYRLADVLAVNVTTLLLSARPPQTVGDDEDVAAVGSLLHATGVITPLDALADALGWEAARLEQALDGLERALSAVGLRLHRLRGGVGLARAGEPVEPSQLVAVLRKHLNRDGVSLGEGRALYRFMIGSPPREPSNAEKVAIGVLANAELLAPDPANLAQLAITGDVRYSLFLDDEPMNGQLAATGAPAIEAREPQPGARKGGRGAVRRRTVAS